MRFCGWGGDDSCPRMEASVLPPNIIKPSASNLRIIVTPSFSLADRKIDLARLTSFADRGGFKHHRWSKSLRRRTRVMIMSIVRMDYRGRSEWTIVEAGLFCRDSATICSLPTCGGTRVLLVVPDLREILS